MIVWVTKYALTTGIIEVEGEVCKNLPEMIDVGKGVYYHKPYWYEIRIEAVSHAEQMKIKKLVALRKQINKLTKKDFK